MAGTLFVHRLVWVVPTASMGAVGSWHAANVDPDDDGASWPTLNATGLLSDPETHRWANASLTEPKARSIINRVCQMTGTPMPSLPQWNAWTKAQKYGWLRSVQNQLFTGSGIWLDLADNEAAWDLPQQILDGLGLQVRQEPPA